MSLARKFNRGRARSMKHFIDEDGNKVVPLSPKAVDLIKQQLVRFKKKFGREPGPDDPIFFDPNSDVPVQFDEAKFNHGVVEAMKKAGIRGELIYAFEKTGLILNAEGYENVLPEDRAEWDAAIDEYRRIN
jgi:hypothetical protein